MNKKVTIKDVAKLANVSSATVSYVLNDVRKVSYKTKKRVHEAIEQLGYYPDLTAVGLAKRNSKIIGIILPITEDKAATFRNNLYYNEFVSGVEMVLRNRNYDTMITGVENLEECKTWIQRRNLDGVIFLGMFPERLYEEMTKLNIPIVLIDTYEEYTESFSYIHIDDELGGYYAAKHLIDLGHENIAFVATSLSLSPVDRLRYKGFKRAHNEANLEISEELIYEVGEITFEKGLVIGEKVVENARKITGIVTVSDILAIGTIKALQQKQKQIPEDYSIIGFDDLSISQYTTPSLTTVRQDIFNKGKSAAELLVNNIEEVEVEKQIIELPVDLIIRESTTRVKN